VTVTSQIENFTSVDVTIHFVTMRLAFYATCGGFVSWRND